LEDNTLFLKEGFVRQRRNLMIMSVLIIIQETAGLKYEVLSVLGNEVTVEHSVFIVILTYIMFVYWWIRYFQYMGDLRDSTYSKIFATRFLNNIRDSHEYIEQSEKFRSSVPNPSKVNLVRFGLFSIHLMYIETAEFDPLDPFNEIEVEPTLFYKFPFGLCFFTWALTHFGLAAVSRFFTEYYFPHLLALLAVGSMLYMNFGSLNG